MTLQLSVFRVPWIKIPTKTLNIIETLENTYLGGTVILTFLGGNPRSTDAGGGRKIEISYPKTTSSQYRAHPKQNPTATTEKRKQLCENHSFYLFHV